MVDQKMNIQNGLRRILVLLATGWFVLWFVIFIRAGSADVYTLR